MPGLLETLKASLSTAAKDSDGQVVPMLHRIMPLATTVAGVLALGASLLGYVPASPRAQALLGSLAAVGSAYVMRMGHTTPVAKVE